MTKITSFRQARQALAQFMAPATSYGPAVLSLEDMVKLMHALGDPQEKVKVIHVAGTSGKTSNSYYMASLLQQAGYQVGLTVSPHVDEINERLQINIVPMPEKLFCKELSAFLEVLAEIPIKPSYFALMIAFAYWEFARQEMDYAVVEVGMGGLLDATNVVNRHDKLCIITDIGLDHTEFLGSTLGEIASQKAGIIKPYNTVFCYEQSDDVMNVIREVCEQEQAELHEIWPMAANKLPADLPLFQRRNWYLALQAYQYIEQRDGMSEMSVVRMKDSTEIYIPARMEVITYKDKTIIIDGAHNAQKLGVLFKSLRNNYPKQPLAVLFSSVEHNNRRTKGAIEVIAKHADHVIITTFSGEQDVPKQGVKPSKLAELFHMDGYDAWQTINDPAEAFAALLKCPEPVLLITGSFYMMNHIRPLLRKLIKKES